MREASRYNWHDRGTDAESRLLAAHQILTPGRNRVPWPEHLTVQETHELAAARHHIRRARYAIERFTAATGSGAGGAVDVGKNDTEREAVR